jgi:putative ABC transport system substrate-binding protein
MLPSLAWTDQTAAGFRIGVLIPPVPSLEKPLRESLRDIGYSDSSNPPIEWRRSDGQHEELKSLALDLIERDVDVIVVWGTPAVRAVLDATKTVPIVFCIADPLATGVVTSLASPGGNATGMGLLTRELTAKRLQLLRQLLPRARRIGYLRNPSNPIAPRMFTESEQAAHTLGVELVAVDAANSREVGSTLRALPEKKLDALIVSGDLLFLKERAQIAGSVRTARLPTAFPGRENLESGAVMSYGWNMKDVMRSTAAYVDKIRRGAKPSDLPVEQVSRYELIVNLRVARELGLDVPQDMLLRADHVIR